MLCVFFQQLKIGDIVYGKIQSPQPGGYLIRLLCTHPSKFYIFNDVKARVKKSEKTISFQEKPNHSSAWRMNYSPHGKTKSLFKP